MAPSKERIDQIKFEPEALRSALDFVGRTVGRYFRLKVLSAENIPAGRCMVVGCHSGVAPYDAACALVAIERETGRLAHSVGHRFWGEVETVERYLRRRGVFVGTTRELARRLRAENIVLVMPGGANDMMRPIWQSPYRVLPHKGFAPGRGGYIKAALRTRSPIVPMAVVGTEEVHGMLYNVRPLANALRFPYFPLVASVFPLPTRIYVRFGKPIRFRHAPAAADRQDVVDRLNKRVRRSVQSLIDDTLRRRRGIFWSDYDDSPSGRRR